MSALKVQWPNMGLSITNRLRLYLKCGWVKEIRQMSPRDDAVTFVSQYAAQRLKNDNLLSITKIDHTSLSGSRVLTSTYVSKAATTNPPTKELVAIQIQDWSRTNIPPEKFMKFFAEKGDLICIFWTSQSAYAIFRPEKMDKELSTGASVTLDTTQLTISKVPDLFQACVSGRIPYRRPVHGDAWFSLFCDVFSPTLRSFLCDRSYTEEEEKMILWELYTSLPYHLRPRSIPPPRVCGVK